MLILVVVEAIVLITHVFFPCRLCCVWEIGAATEREREREREREVMGC
jgi:hypothetical protein